MSDGPLLKNDQILAQHGVAKAIIAKELYGLQSLALQNENGPLMILLFQSKRY